MEFSGKNIQVAITHDHLFRFSKKESTLLALCDIFPDASVYTLSYDEEVKNRYFKDIEIKTSFLQKLPKFLRKYIARIHPLAVMIFENFNLGKYDVVISSSSAFSRGVAINPDSVHISYQPTVGNKPPSNDGGFGKRLFEKIRRHIYRIWDFNAINRIDYIVSGTKGEKKSISKTHKKDAFIVYPPATAPQKKTGDYRYGNTLPDEFFLLAAEDIEARFVKPVIDAFNILNIPLVVLCSETKKKDIQKNTRGSIYVFANYTPEFMQECYRKCFAYVSANNQNFDVSAVEAMLYGKPVLAYGGGWAQEIMVPGVGGEFFDGYTPEPIVDGARRLKNNYLNYNESIVKSTGSRFTSDRFYREFTRVLKRILEHEFDISYADR